MKAIRCEVLMGWAMALAMVLPPTALGAPAPIRISDPSICIDGMETVPVSDELEPILAAADSGCTAPQGPVSI
jgi:hypothetical protein